MFLKGIPLLREPLPKSKSSAASRNKAILEKLRFFEVLFLANFSSTVGSKACTYMVFFYKVILGLGELKQFDQKILRDKKYLASQRSHILLKRPVICDAKGVY